MNRANIVVTEAGESSITPAVLIDVLASAILHATTMGDVDGPTCSYIISALNTMGSLGLLELRSDKPKKGQKIDTQKPPSFIAEVFGDFGKEQDGKTDSGK